MEIPAGAISTPADIRLTPISNQGLAGLLPLGWSPLAALDIRALDPTAGTTQETTFASAATIKLPLPASLTLDPAAPPILALYDPASHSWKANGSATVAADGLSATADVTAVGQYALVLPDPAPNAPAAAQAGAPLAAASSVTLDYAAVTASSKVVPQAAPPSTGLKAAGEVVLTAKEGATPTFTSGLVLGSRITEKFDLKSGDRIDSLPYTQDIILYRAPCITNPGNGAVSPVDVAALRTTFPVSPSRDFTIVDLLLGKISVDIIPPVTNNSGVMVGTDGGRLVDADGNVLVVPQGALTLTTPVSTANANPLAAIGSDFVLIKAVALNLTGQTLTKSAILSIPVTAGLDQNLPIVVAKEISIKGVSKLKLIALAKQAGSLITSDITAAGLDMPGITTTGTYYFLQAKEQLGFVTGTVSDSGNAPFTGAFVKTDKGSLVDLASSNGRYLLAAPVAPFIATALDLYKNDEVSASSAVTIANQIVSLDLKIEKIPPTVVSISPTNGAVKVQPDVPVVVTFSKPMDKSSINSTTLRCNDSTGTSVTGSLTFSVDNRTVTFYPNEQFKQEATYTVTIASSVKDLQGYPLGQQITSGFTVRKTTPPPMPAAGSVSATFPDANGFITITATQGSAEVGNTVLLINDTTGEITSITPQTNGSFTGKIRGQLGDEIKVVLMDYSGNQTTISYLTFKGPDGSYLVTAKGGKVEGEGGSILEIPEGALVGPVIIKVTALQEANLPSPLQAPGKYLGAFNVDSGGIGFQKEVHLSIPLPPGFNSSTPVFVTRPAEVMNGDGSIEKVYEIIDSTKIINGRITTASPPFDGIMGFGSYIFTAFPEVNVGIVSGYTYQDMNEQSGYQEAPNRAAWDELMPGALASDLKYKYDRPVQGAVIRTPAAWNYVSYSKSTGFYAGFTTLYANVGATDLEYKLAAIHPQTMRRENITGYLSADGTTSYNIKNLNFKLADKDTVVPDKAAPIISIDMQVAPGQPPDIRIIAGTVLVGTEIQVPIAVLDQQMGSANLTVTFTDPILTETYPILVRQTGLPTLFTPQTGAKPAIWRHTFTSEFQSLIAATNPANFRPNRVGLYSFIVEATDNAGNKSRQFMQLRTVSADTSLGVSKDGPPTVDSLTPSDKARDIMVSIPITVVFSEPVTNVTSDTFKLIDLTAGRAPGVTVEITVPATVTTGIVNGRMQAVLTPKSNLYYDRDYQVVLTGDIKDLPDKNDSATTPDKRFPLAEVRTTFSTKKPTSYDLADNLFSGRDIDLYYSRETMKLYSYVTAGDQGWRVVEVTDPTSPQVVWPRPDLGIPSADFKFPAEFNYRNVAVHPDPNNPLLGMTENINFADGNQFGYVRFYSLDDPAKPELVGKEKLAEAYSGIPGRLALFEDYAFVATINSGLQVVSITKAKANLIDNIPSDGSSIVGVFDSVGQGLGQPSDILVLNGVNALFTTTSGSLVTIDIADPYFPMLVTSIGQNDGRRFTRIAAAMQYQYMDTSNIPRSMDLVLAGSQEGKVRTIDMSNPANPQVLAAALDETETGEVPIVARDLTINKESGLAFVTGLDTIYVLDIKDPYRPKVLNRFASLYDPTGARDASGAPVTIPLGQVPSIVERGGWIYAANQQKGVKILNFDPPTIVPDPGRYFVLLDENDKATRNYLLTYKIQTDPGTNGDFENPRVILYKNNAQIQLFTNVLPDDPMMLIEAGAPFDIDSSYHARVIVYDRQTKNDIMSPVIPIVVGKFSLSDLEEKYNDLVGAVTDGTSELVLRLIVSPNYQGIKPVFSLRDPQVDANGDITGKLQADNGQEVTSAVIPIDPQTRSSVALYKAPARFVRFGTQEESQDGTRKERSVTIELGVTDIVKEIKLQRPPVVLAHGLWSEPKAWDGFESKLNDNNQYKISKINYKSNNAGAFSSNISKVGTEIDLSKDEMVKNGYAINKLNYIGHSMGGLIFKEYCQGAGNCNDIINKYISIDSPHKGSELANKIIEVDTNKDQPCYSFVSFLNWAGKRVWEDVDKTILTGGIVDLAVGSNSILRHDALVVDFPWTAIVGRSADGELAYSVATEFLWIGLRSFCQSMPDSSFFSILGYNSPIFASSAEFGLAGC